ncbi:MAG: helix-turn-helix domain-containing protein [Lachnospiraceae bacterium]|nr:helix-turn-helix domain-containing protein [Lachnospiraceae bacterium]
MYSIGEIIANNRKRKGLSQPELARLLNEAGFDQSYKAISKWERDSSEPSVTIFLAICRILGITDIYESYFGFNPGNPLSSLNQEGQAKAQDYISLLHASGLYERQECNIIPFRRQIDIYENAVSAGTGNFLVDGPRDTVTVTDPSLIPSHATFGVRISGDSMEPEFSDGQIAWVLQKDDVEDGEIGIFSLNGEAYIKRLQDNRDGLFLVSLNTSYPPIPVKESDRLDTFGVVVGKSVVSDIPDYKG